MTLSRTAGFAPMTKNMASSVLCLGFALAVLAGCSGPKVEEAKPYVTEQKERIRQQSGTIHGDPDGFVLYRTGDKDGDQKGDQNGDEEQPKKAVTGKGGDDGGAVNAYLWQASLESLDFMPLTQADSRGGVIITDWYAPPETPDERFKITVYIRDRELRADAFKVVVFRQVQEKQGWVDATVDRSTVTGLEDNILTRARELRLTSTGEASNS